MMVLLGVGNTLLSDDGVGCSIADSFSAEGWITYNGGTAPENFTAPIRRADPALLLIVDAAEMNLSPGSIRIIQDDQIDDTSIGTHMLPLSHLIRYLSPDIPEILFIGIQPETINPGVGLSPAVQAAAESLIIMLQKGEYADLDRL
ncbi:hydrogenase maturation peptidase HycI [Methanocalculus sp.]|uniref:hydrogenase maturation peptidase HycI n=1 Tax=Methanocalculus sp. TaxID=2004547 RepID=UPI002720D3A3|nr:hydrogenase maturation peptidase HycI [Methanocalculus sp.]MDO8840732.1 hydrogenase maturation peptidase HycI [Methanocalculus sp.]